MHRIQSSRSILENQNYKKQTNKKKPPQKSVFSSHIVTLFAGSCGGKEPLKIQDKKSKRKTDIILRIHNPLLESMKHCLFFQFFLFIHQSSVSQTHFHLLQDEAEQSERVFWKML